MSQTFRGFMLRVTPATKPAEDFQLYTLISHKFVPIAVAKQGKLVWVHKVKFHTAKGVVTSNELSTYSNLLEVLIDTQDIELE